MHSQDSGKVGCWDANPAGTYPVRVIVSETASPSSNAYIDLAPVNIGDTFVVPEAVIPPSGARVMDLQHPDRKMSKSEDSPQGTILVLDDAGDIERKVKRAVTDSDNEVHFDPDGKPGVSNLLSILGASTGRSPVEAATGIESYGDLKTTTADAVVEMLRPIQARYRELAADPAFHCPSISEIEQADAVVILGEDVTNTAPRLALALRQSVRNKALSLAEDCHIPSWQDAAVRELAQQQRSPLCVLGSCAL
jgi:hypothetical protein